MAIKLERDKKGNVIAIDSETGKKVGNVVTQGDTQPTAEKIANKVNSKLHNS